MTMIRDPAFPKSAFANIDGADPLPHPGLLGGPAADPHGRRRRGGHPLLPALHRLPAVRPGFDLEQDVSDRDLFLRISWLRANPHEAEERGAVSEPRLARTVTAASSLGVVVAAVLGTAAFLVMIQGAFRKGHTDLDFNHVLGTA